MVTDPSTIGLFPAAEPVAPLAERMRPLRLEDVVGQQHLLAPGKPLEVAARSGRLHSMILWGPPGVGKTTLARLLARDGDAHFIPISAVFAGVRDIREAVQQAELALQERGQRTILFVDEVHRFNKAQQDAFLPFVERGLLTFIGATTENPSFEVNSALLSRAVVYVLHPLGPGELAQLFERTLSGPLQNLTFDGQARDAITEFADGDARRMLNLLEQIAGAAEAQRRGHVDVEFAGNAMAESLRRFDKGGDLFYEQISALHKSVRGSAPDASVYWLCRMLDGGADPLYIGRRLVRMAIEDVGLADPRALRLTLDACETYERLGSPEGELALAQAAIYLACAPKSNAAYRAYEGAREFIARDGTRPVPNRLRNAPTRLMQKLGYGKDYRYAHDEADAYAAGEAYFPDEARPPRFYEPTTRGLEGRIGEKLAHLRDLDATAQARNQNAPSAEDTKDSNSQAAPRATR